MKTLITATAAAFALALSSASGWAADDDIYPEDRQSYEAEAHKKIMKRQNAMDDMDLGAEAEEAWDEVQESWGGLTAAADENWDAARESFEDSWEGFQEAWEDFSSSES